MTNPNHKLFDEFKVKYDEILTPIVKDLQKAGFTEKNIDSLINQLFQTHRVEPKTTEVILQLSVNALIAGGLSIPKSEIKATKQWLLKNNWFEDALPLSKTIHQNVVKLKNNIGFILKQNLGASVNWQKSAQDIFKLKDIKAELPKYMEKLIADGKKALQDPALIADFNKQAKKAQKQINKLSNLGYKNPRLKKAYQNIIDQVKKGSITGLNKGVERAVKAKSKYIAERIARTEIASAYGNATMWEAKKDKKIVAVRSVLSARHNILDVCDLYAKSNMYGLGKGVFPKNRLPKYPFHPQCACSLVPLTKNQIGVTKKVNKQKQIKKFIKETPKIANKKGQIPLYTDKKFVPRKPKNLD